MSENKKTTVTVKEYYNFWQQTMWQDEANYAFSTTRSWESIFTKHILPFIGEYKIDEIDFSSFQKHLSNDYNTRKTANNTKQALRALLQAAEKQGYITDVPTDFEKLKLPKDIKKKRTKVHNVLTDEQYNKIIRYMREHDSYYANTIAFLRETGLRIEELAITPNDLVLRVDHQHPENNSGILHVNRAIKRTPKGEEKSELVVSEEPKSAAAYRDVPLSAYAIDLIRWQQEYYRRNNIKTKYIFSTSTGTLLEKRNVLRAFHTAIDGYNRENNDNIPKRGLHSLRKLCCKTLKDDIKLDWELLREVMGHSSDSVTKKYYYSVSENDVMDISSRINAVRYNNNVYNSFDER